MQTTQAALAASSFSSWFIFSRSISIFLISRKRGKALQKARAKKIYNRMQPQAGPRDSSEDENSKPNYDKNRKPFSSLGSSRKFTGKKALEKKLLECKKLLKKPHKRRVYKEGSGPRTNSGAGGDSFSTGVGSGSQTKKTGGGGGSLSPRKNLQRKSLSATGGETEPEGQGVRTPTSPVSLAQHPSVGGYPSPHYNGQSGLIVGYVSFRNKTKTREERKMEMIMKAFEAMERNEARKRNKSDTQASTKPKKKRRQSNSTKACGKTAALDQSSADEGYGGSSNKKKGRGKRVGGAGSVAGSRRRSRAKSGDSSAVSETETADETLEARYFKYPGHRVSEDQDDDVSRRYIRGSRSPPGIANHMLRSARTDKTSSDDASNMSEGGRSHQAGGGEAKTIGYSAKKRWLMAAMSVDMSDTDRLEEAGTNLALASSEPDYTPLKKRRLATYSIDASEDVIAKIAGDSAVSEKIKSLPNGLKKRLISNLVLEAMEDYKPGTFNDENMDNNN